MWPRRRAAAELAREDRLPLSLPPIDLQAPQETLTATFAFG